MRIRLGLSLAFAFLTAACTEDEGPLPSVAGQSAEEAAEISTDVACDYAARCGHYSVSCSDCVGDGCVGCFVEHTEVEYGACTAELGPDFETGFACEELTPEEEALVDECLHSVVDAPCVSQEEVEAWVNGGGGEDPRTISDACDLLEEIRYRCFDYDYPNTSEPIPD